MARWVRLCVRWAIIRALRRVARSSGDLGGRGHTSASLSPRTHELNGLNIFGTGSRVVPCLGELFDLGGGKGPGGSSAALGQGDGS